MALNCAHRARFDWIALRHLHCGCQNLGETQRAVFCKHDHEPAGRAWRNGRERAEFGRIVEALFPEEVRGRPGWRNAQCVDSQHLLRMRVVDEGLGLAAPAQYVPHRGGRRKHRAGGVDRVTAAKEGARACRGGQRLAGDRHPVLAVQHGLLRIRARYCSQANAGQYHHRECN